MKEQRKLIVTTCTEGTLISDDDVLSDDIIRDY